MLALIGPGWLDAKDASGNRRLESPTDYVRQEIAAALKRNISVTPVLLQGAAVPPAERLPEDIRDLAFRNGFELSHTRWESDVHEMVKRLGIRRRAAHHEEVTARPAGPRGKYWIGAGLTAVLGLVAWMVFSQFPLGVADAEPAPSDQNAVAAAPATDSRKTPDPSRDIDVKPTRSEVPARAETPSGTPPQTDICRQGYVWREASPADHVCVPPETRTGTAEENQLADTRRSPTGGPYGPDTCVQGYVWRDAFAGDHVCVGVESRDRASTDNGLADSRRLP
jgi:hypothetical protein